MELYQNSEWGFRQRDKALRSTHYFDKLLHQQAFIAGEKFSTADITVIGGLVFASIVKLACLQNVKHCSLGSSG